LFTTKAVLSVEVTIYNHQIYTFYEDLENKAFRKALNQLPIVRGYTYLKEEIAKLG